MISIIGIDPQDQMRLLDPSTLKFFFRVEEFELIPIIMAIKEVQEKTKMALGDRPSDIMMYGVK